MDKDEYGNHLSNNITSAYKKTNETKVKAIDKKAYKIANQLGLDDRM